VDAATLVARLRSRLFADPPTRHRLTTLADAMSLAGVACYLVGGVIRDTIRPALDDSDEPSLRDVDFAVPLQGLSVAEAWANRNGGRPVVLDNEHPTLRIVAPDGSTADFTALRAQTLDADLRRRDFTVNAIAVSLAELVGESNAAVVDPCVGVADVERGVLRWASASSLADDPLRMLRAFRFVATPGYELDPTCVDSIRADRHRIHESANERVRDELFRILATNRAYATLRAMDDLRLLTEVLPELEPMRGVPQNDYHHLDVWEHTLEAIQRFDAEPVPEPLAECADAIHGVLRTVVAQGITMAALVRFGLLFHDVAKPQTRSVESDGRVRFIGHDEIGAEIAYATAKRLTLANRACEVIKTLVAEHLATMHLSGDGAPSSKAIRRFCRRIGDLTSCVLAHSWADMNASRGPARTVAQRTRTAAVLRETARVYFNQTLPLRNRRRLITGRDLMTIFGVAEGPIVGALLNRVQEAQLDGTVQNRDDALALVRDELAQRRDREFR
jgi:putative nucleotidyltransferase with HDIG domain